ncbi:MAG: flagellar basal body P-ring formation chaperone FlgA [Nitrospirae bacterium]|nr:flagellar basal body P-ring formation chaperone FlgA [Nitrospirota bacterium]MCL5977508.1 flagellar basal body P-ring formation chaperone FlgA [Nitrospirota bacterium]
MKGNRQRAIGDRQDSKHINYVLSAVGCLLLLTAILIVTTAGAVPKGHLLDKVKQAVLKDLVNSFSENVELTGIRIVKGMDIIGSEGDYTVKDAAMNGYNGKNRVFYSVSLADKKAVHNVVVEASYDIIVDVFIASRPLAVGAVLTGDDFYTVKQKSSRLPAGAVLNKKDIEGKMLRSNVGQGVILRGDYMTDRMSIKRGQKVNVVVEGDNVSVATQGMLRNDAVVGGAAKVFCDVSKKEVNGILVSPNTVRVKI